MPIPKMLKVRIVAHSIHKDTLIETLHSAGLVEIINLEEVPEGGFVEELEPTDLERKIADIGYAIDFLYTYSEKPSLIESFFSPRYSVERSYYENLIITYDFSILDRVKALDQNLSELKNEETRLKSLIEQLTPWYNLSLPLEDTETDKTITEFGMLPTEATSEFSAVPYLHLEIPQATERKIWAAVTYHRDYREDVDELMRRTDFQKISLPSGLKGTPQENLDRIAEDMDTIREKQEEVEKKCSELASERFNLMIMYDYYTHLKEKHDVRREFINTEKTFVLNGWIQGKDVSRLHEGLSHMKEVDISTSHPDESDTIPVNLENRGVFRRFELVTKIYGMPMYKEIDPTLLLTPFFIVFFALCLSDFIYGVALIGLSILVPRKIKMGPDGKLLFKVLLIGGMMTIIFGLLTSGWAGDLTAQISFLAPLEHMRNALGQIDLLKNPLIMLEVALILGLIQVWAGILIRGYMNIRDGYVLDAVIDQGLWLILLPVGTLTLINKMFGVDIPYANMMFNLTLASLGGLVLTQGRYQKASNLPLTLLKKLMVGFLSIYNIFGYLGDVLSYSRILALGLATAALASAFNMVAIQIGGLIPLIGPIVVVVALIVLHTLNLIISGLGAFVHSGRLQFVEYFTKFLEGGGRAFKPFGTYTKYINVKEEESHARDN